MIDSSVNVILLSILGKVLNVLLYYQCETFGITNNFFF